GIVQQHLTTRDAVVDQRVAVALRADQELMAMLVGMLAAQRSRRYAEHDQIPLRLKRKSLAELADGQVAAGIPHPGKTIEIDAAHAGRFTAHLLFTGFGRYPDRGWF